ncbi:hypothetical protein V502_01921, partial [Pseudogymnoascus sp. VKM F-4520 (FW-2644)]
MPPIRSQNAQKLEQQEGRILLAIQAIQNKDIPSIRQAAAHFQVPNSTLAMRLSGRTPRANSRVNNHKLTETEEESLLNWILDLDLRGLAPRPETVREIADLLLKERGDNLPKTVG